LPKENNTTLSPDSQFGHYEIRSLLGQGGMGEVYLAYDSRLRRQVAIKLLPLEFTENKARLARFEREAYAASSLNHPNILTIHEIGEHDGHHFIATEYVEGESLRQRLTHAPTEPRETLGIVIQVADALAAAHDAGIVHRDIKPENVMLRRDGYVKVLDFGLAKLANESSTPEVTSEARTMTRVVKTDPGVVMGTASYMSPEQARGLEVDARTDIWSLGSVIYEMVAGRLPFEGTTTSDVIATILHREPPSLLLYRSGIPAELERIVEKALTKDREERYQLAKELSVDLKRLKQRLELEAELERSVTPDSGAGAGAGKGGGRSTTGVRPTNEAHVAHTVSSAEYVVGEIKRHKRAALLVIALIIATGAGAICYYKYFGNRSQGITSIAVLPFVNASGDANADYLADGISEDLIDKLSQLPGLKVIARSSAFKYKGKDFDPQEVANALGVDAIVSGRVVQRGGQLQVRAELINARDKTQLWGEQYSRSMTDVQSVQDEIAHAISEKLRVRLTGAGEEQLSKRATTNPEAYQLYLNGVYYRRKGSQDLPKALDLYNRAVTLDPNFAVAWVGVADIYTQLAGTGMRDPSDANPKAKAAVKKALELDETLPDAHVMQGRIMTSEWDWNGAEREFKRAFELSSNLSEAHLTYASLLSLLGRHDEAIASARRAQEVDPLDLRARNGEGVSLYFARRYDEAIQKFENVLKLTPDNETTLIFRAYTYDAKEMYKEAISEYQKLVAAGDTTTSTQCYLGYVLAQSGKKTEAQAIQEKLKTTKDYVSPAEFAVLYVGLGDKDGAIGLLEKAYAVHDLQMQYLKVDPHYDRLRGDPRFVDLMKKVGLPQ
jgi:serine/threonine protein kinase/TolB-like protein/Tfp pilus assembly protein PilF